MPELKEPVVQIMSQAQIFSRSSSPHSPELFNIFSKLQDFVSSVSRRIRDVEAALNAIEPGIAITAKEFTLTSDLVLPHPSEPIGSFILYVWIQDGTGGWAVTFPSSFKGFIQPDPTPGFYSTMLAYKKSESIVLPAAGFVPGIDVS